MKITPRMNSGSDSGARTHAGIAGDGTTGFYIDETPVPDSIDPRVLDVQRIEVLRGPQGTLYGARSMGGTVRLITDNFGRKDGPILFGWVLDLFGGQSSSGDGLRGLWRVPSEQV